MSQLWPSINSSKRTSDSTRRSNSKINKLKLSLGLSSPKSYSNFKGTPSHLISTSILSSVSSIPKTLPDKCVNSSYGRKPFQAYSSVASKCSYRMDAALLIFGRIRKFIYKHFHIWRLAAGRSITAEKRNHSNKSLVIQVTISREKKRFHSISRSSVEQNCWSSSPKDFLKDSAFKRNEAKFEFGRGKTQNQPEVPFVKARSKVQDKDPPMRLSDFESPGPSQILQSFSSQKAFMKKQFKSFTSEEKQLFSFESGSERVHGPVRPVIRNFSYMAVERKRTLERVVKILDKCKEKRLSDCFFTIFAVFIFKLNFLKILAGMVKKLNLRMKVLFDGILKSQVRGQRWREANERKSRGFMSETESCRKAASSGSSWGADASKNPELILDLEKIKPNEINIRESYESLRKSIQEISSASSRNSDFRKNPRVYHHRAQKLHDLLSKLLSKLNFRLKSLSLSIIFSPYSDPSFHKNLKKLFEVSSRNLKSSVFFILKQINSSVNHKLKATKEFRKKFSKIFYFLTVKCFQQWKTQTFLFTSKDLRDLKAKTFESTFNSILKSNQRFGFLALKYFRKPEASRIKLSFKVKLIKAVKRISKHLNFFKAKAFQKFKYYRQEFKGNQNELQVVSSFVKIIKSKILRNFRYFFAKVSRFN